METSVYLFPMSLINAISFSTSFPGSSRFLRRRGDPGDEVDHFPFFFSLRERYEV